MKVAYNDIIPFEGYKAMTVWPVLFVRRDAEMTDADLRHEEIHGMQQKEMLIVPFFLWYAVEYVIRLIIYRNAHKAYRKISFECEAYLNEYDSDYLETRKHYAWMKYIV